MPVMQRVQRACAVHMQRLRVLDEIAANETGYATHARLQKANLH